jgi:hypothetical protein
MRQHFMYLGCHFWLKLGPENCWIVFRNVADERPESNLVIIAYFLDLSNYRTQILKSRSRQSVIAKCDIEIRIACSACSAFLAGIECSKLDCTTVETKCPCHMVCILAVGVSDPPASIWVSYPFVWAGRPNGERYPLVVSTAQPDGVGRDNAALPGPALSQETA